MQQNLFRFTFQNGTINLTFQATDQGVYYWIGERTDSTANEAAFSKAERFVKNRYDSGFSAKWMLLATFNKLEYPSNSSQVLFPFGGFFTATSLNFNEIPQIKFHYILVTSVVLQ